MRPVVSLFACLSPLFAQATLLAGEVTEVSKSLHTLGSKAQSSKGGEANTYAQFVQRLLSKVEQAEQVSPEVQGIITQIVEVLERIKILLMAAVRTPPQPDYDGIVDRDSESSIEARQGIIDSLKNQAEACRREEELAQAAASQDCTDLQSFVVEVKDAICLHTSSLDGLDHDALTKGEDILSEYSNWQQTFAANYQSWNGEGGRYSTYKTKRDLCTNSTQDHSEKQGDCDSLQDQHHAQWCARVAEHEAYCQSFNSDEQALADEFERQKGIARAANDALAQDFRTVEYIECFLTQMNSSTDTETPADWHTFCNGQLTAVVPGLSNWAAPAMEINQHTYDCNPLTNHTRHINWATDVAYLMNDGKSCDE